MNLRKTIIYLIIIVVMMFITFICTNKKEIRKHVNNKYFNQYEMLNQLN